MVNDIHRQNHSTVIPRRRHHILQVALYFSFLALATKNIDHKLAALAKRGWWGACSRWPFFIDNPDSDMSIARRFRKLIQVRGWSYYRPNYPTGRFVCRAHAKAVYSNGDGLGCYGMIGITNFIFIKSGMGMVKHLETLIDSTPVECLATAGMELLPTAVTYGSRGIVKCRVSPAVGLGQVLALQ